MPYEDDVFLQVKKWAIEDRVFKIKLPDKDGISWAMDLTYPSNHPTPISIIILSPNGSDFISLQVSMKLDPNILSRLKKIGQSAIDDFYYRMQVMFLEKDIAFSVDKNNNTWIIVETIHFDGLTKNELFKTIRRIYNSTVLVNMILSNLVG